ncbi:MAG: replicative DNA helicase, partial [Bacteroidales bacterium]
MAKQIKQGRPVVTVLPDFGKIPPQAIDMEEAVLGAIMLEKEAVITVLDILKPESFYKDAHKKIFKAISDLNTREYPVDLYTVTEELRAHQELDSVGGPVYLTQLTSKVVSAANVDYHSRIVAQKYIQRELIRVSTEIQTRSFDDTYDVTELLDYSENELFQIAEGNIKREVSPINVVIKEAIAEIEKAGKREDALVGIPSGFTKLDRLTSGWQKSELIIIAARPSMGKTALALSMARNMSIDHGKNVAIFSCEMSSIQLVNRLIIAETDIPGDKIRNGRLSEEEWKQLDTRIKKLIQASIYIDDTPAISIFELRAKCRRLMAQHKLDIVIVDYLQLVSGYGRFENRNQEMAYISRSLKELAKELPVRVLVYSRHQVPEATGDIDKDVEAARRNAGMKVVADGAIETHTAALFEPYTDDPSTKGMLYYTQEY